MGQCRACITVVARHSLNKSANSCGHVEVAALRNSNSSINGHWLGRFSRLNDSFIGKKTLQTTDQIVSVTSGHGTIRVEVTDRSTGGMSAFCVCVTCYLSQ